MTTTANFVGYTVGMACLENLKAINMDAEGGPNRSADIKVETDEIPISVKADPGRLYDCGVKDQTLDKIDALFYMVGDHSSYDTKPNCLKIEEVSREYDNEWIEDHHRLIKEEQHRTWNEYSNSSPSGEKHLIESGPSSYELKSDVVDIGEFKMEEDVDDSESSNKEDATSGEQNSAGHGEKFGVTFNCIKCEKVFSSKLSLDYHVVTLHSDDCEMMKSVSSKIHRCEHCKYIAVLKNDLINHMRTHRETFRTTFNCIKCEKKFSSKQSLDNHIVTLHSDDCEMMKKITHKIFHCKHCKYFTVKKSNLTNHMRTHGKKLGVTFNCIKCEKKFSSKLSLDNHIVVSHSVRCEMMKGVTNKINGSEHCKYVKDIKSDLTNHMSTHRETFRTTFNCIKCEKKFSSKQSLDNHIVASHGDDCEMMESVTYKIYRCKHCKYLTVRKPNLTNHMRKHGEKFGITFNCIKCEKKFSSQQSLDNHIVTSHSDDCEMMESVTYKIHGCNYCKYFTVRKSDLPKHMGKHVEKCGITFNCLKCKKEFSSKQCLDKHIVASHSDDCEMMKGVTNKIYRCEHCKYFTTKKPNLTNHMRTHRKKFGVTFSCTKCKKRFSIKQSLDNHIVRLHSDDCKMMKSVTYKIHRCKHCRYLTIFPICLTRHMRNH